MSGETDQFDQTGERAKPEAEKRTVSTISFPYLDLDAAVEVAKAMYDTRGHGAMEAADLAATLNQTVSGNFRLKTGTARIFGLTDKEGRDLTKLSDLGLRIIEERTEQEARADAFMRVPLYSAIYEQYKGQRLPPPKALEREMEGLGVSGKQTDKARQAFERSARQAGFFAKGEDRLVKPHFAGDREDRADDVKADPPKDDFGGGGGDGGGGQDPLIIGLVNRLPVVGSDWGANDRVAWLTLATSIFDVVYGKEAEIPITIAMPRPKEKAADE